mmetsp:Transcript_26564/g.54008  ORF Transcript_26564/g.54008 Transcript_26564/m.54008 type:complete len:116 (-) Transcript_26564:1154-1501(-)
MTRQTTNIFALLVHIFLLLSSSLPSTFGQDCIVCTNIPTKGMLSKNKECTATRVSKGKKCVDSPNWITNGYCQQSCYDAGRGYDDILCCDDDMAKPTAAPVSSPTCKLSSGYLYL